MKPIKWEYMTVIIMLDVQSLNKFGAEGWELITVAGNWMIFKRRKQ